MSYRTASAPPTAPMPGGPRVVLAFDHFAKYCVPLAGAMAARGCDLTLLSRDHDFEFGGARGEMLSFVRSQLPPTVEHRIVPGRVRAVAALGRVFGVARAIRASAPQVVHLQESVVDDARLIAASGARPARYALTIHDPSPHPGDAVRPAWKLALRRALIGRAGLIFVHADALRDELWRLERPPAPIVVVPHGVESTPAAPLPDRPHVLFFGRLSHYKGLDTLLDAMPFVWAELPEATLTVAGSGALPPHPALTDPRVTTRREHVPEAEVPALFGAATCVALPYRQASQSGIGSLAKQFGRGMVATSVGGLPELVGDAGLLVPPEDPPALASALCDVLARPERARSFGEAAARSARQEGGWDRVADLTLAAYLRHLVAPPTPTDPAGRSGAPEELRRRG